MRTSDGIKKNLLLTLILAAACGCARNDQAVIFATARTRGRIWPHGAEGPEKAQTGGFAVLKNLYLRETLPKLIVDSGGWFSSTPEGFLTRGKSTIACMNAVPYSLAAAGMDDLSLPPRELCKLAATAGFPVLASNLYLKTNKKPGEFASYKLLQAGKHKIGFFSLIISNPARPNRAKYLPSYKLEKETYEAGKAIKALKDAGAQMIVLLANINPKTSAKPEFYREFLSRVPRIDLIITDDPAVKKPFKANRSWIVRAGLGMEDAAKITLDIEPASGRLAKAHWEALPLPVKEYGQAPDVMKVARTYRAAADAHFSKRIGFLSEALPLAENGSSPVAEFAADCIKTWAKANAAIISVSEPAAGFSSGPVTVAGLYSAFPLDSSVVFVKIRGDDLESAIAGMPPSEISVSGLKLFLKDGALERAETKTGPLVPAKAYHLAVPDSMVNGREHTVLTNAMEFANSRRRLREIVGWCFSRKRTLSRPEGGRIVRN
ncbi:MAG: hypothetical protein COT18_06025 [Elusimicrobia bacterium CG08_land_8_20_14_0_20_59_10]|nr:MAG: hypothetical protein COT18_06025 [Elusimicrobia bacterium CG08_land_8_20_14_0_20_59_10]